MNENREKRLEIAERIYELDAEVYRILGSSLGRVFNGKRDNTIAKLADLLLSHNRSGHILRSEMALISNMARTIPDKAERARMEREYQSILADIDALHSSFGSVDIADELLAGLNRSNLPERFSENNHLIICIGRSYGSAGTDIGFELSKALGINYYDTEIFTEVLERLEAEQDHVTDRASFSHKQNMNQNLGIDKRSLREKFREFNRYHGLSKSDAIFFNQSDLLCEMAKREDFIVMGRCADVILTNNRIPHVSIFINAPFERRVQHTMASDELSYKEAVKLLKKLDRQHGHYYNFYTGRQWGNAVNYDLCINSAAYGIEGAVKLIERLIQRTGKAPRNRLED